MTPRRYRADVETRLARSAPSRSAPSRNRWAGITVTDGGRTVPSELVERMLAGIIAAREVNRGVTRDDLPF